ncbi:hypothetical protein CLV49_1715 [Labedella gwakjiensis]|uniref:Asparagine synthase n=1 Tax=Labedella gwakjiensis TaxID=390269 RepID=A0A2P8GVX0_9MICO|nr:hypothetical protein [Labedella gwakjiensis]PSL38103.1 hypothetical protein CLV49_1715 [Labedella gwakjiensis]RUQ87344.1 hypothetical protein ELQ93_10630 [Labedella gwakjiensis]
MTRSFRRMKRRKIRPYVPLEPREPAPVEKLVEEGLAIARHAIAMRVKNQVLVDILRQDGVFVADAYTGIIRDELERFASEQRTYAARMTEELSRVASRPGRSLHQHDYRTRDRATLELRRDGYVLLADALDEAGNDDEFIASVAESAREGAWREVSTTLEARLANQQQSAARDPRYEEDRSDRMRLVAEVDLDLLRKSQRSWGEIEDFDRWE